MKLYELKQHAMLFDKAIAIEPVLAGGREFPKHKGIWNVNKGKPVTIVSKDYTLVQHEQLVNAVADAVMNLNIPAEARIRDKGMTRDSGNKIYVDITFPQQKLSVVGEEFFAGIRIINSYNKTTGVIVAPRLLRLKCMNGMVVEVGFTKTYHVAHTSEMVKDFESTIEQMLREMVNSNEKLKALVNSCIGDSIEWEMMERILRALSPQDKHFEALKEMLKGIERPTRWDLYNAFTAYATHGEQISPNVEAMLQSKAQKVLATPLVQLVPKQPLESGVAQ
jgi:hypothetical protein